MYKKLASHAKEPVFPFVSAVPVGVYVSIMRNTEYPFTPSTVTLSVGIEDPIDRLVFPV